MSFIFGNRFGTSSTIIPSSASNYVPVSTANALTASLLNSRIAVNSDGSINLTDANVNSLTVGNGTTDSLNINGVAVGENLLSVANLTKVADANEELIAWDEKDSYNWSDSNSWNLIKSSVLVSTWIDQSGTYYGLIKTSYNTDLKVGDNTDFYNNFLISKSLDIYHTEEIVVLGFTFSAANKSIVIPDMVSIETEAMSGAENKHAVYYPVREIWSANIYASVNSGSVHALTIQELAKPDSVDYVPAIFNAPYITKISLKRKLAADNYSAFTGCFAKSIRMPNLRKIVGAGYKFISPVFTSLNGTNNHIEEISFPKLEEIKYCIFGCNDNFVTEIYLPKLSKLHETVFLKSLNQLETVELPALYDVQGCDFFLANNYNLEQVHFPSTIRFRPHELLNSSVSITDASGTFNNLVRSTIALLGIDGVYPGAIRYNGTNSMSYFLHGDAKLMNVKQNGASPVAVADLKDKEKCTVSMQNGIMFDFGERYVGASYIVGTSGIVEDLTHLYDRYSLDITSIVTNPTTKFSIGTINYSIDELSKVIVNSSNPAPTGVMVVPIDPRTALLNNMSAPTGRVTNIHSYTSDNVEIGSYHLINDPEFFEEDKIFAINFKTVGLITFLRTVLGENQYVPESN